MTYDKLLLTTAFCCMASDGIIDDREVDIIESMCSNSNHFVDIAFQDEINAMVNAINEQGKNFISAYFETLKNSSLSEQEELTIIDFAIQTIKADDQIEYAEIKFFKVIRHHLKVSDETILDAYPDIEDYLEEDIQTESLIDKITKQYLDVATIPQFKLLNDGKKK